MVRCNLANPDCHKCEHKKAHKPLETDRKYLDCTKKERLCYHGYCLCVEVAPKDKTNPAK